MSDNLFKKRVYGVVIIKSSLANYNADFTGSLRTLPDGTVYATDKVLKFKIRDYLEKIGKKVFVKTKYKEDGNPMTLDEMYKHHFQNDDKDKIIILNNLLSMLDVRLFGITFAKKGDNNVNLSIHGPVQISYGVNRFEEMKDSGMFTDQIGSPYASGDEKDQTTLGAQTRSFEAHYVHHFSINPKNLSMFVEQVVKERLISEFIKIKKEVLDKEKIGEKIDKLTDEDLKKVLKKKLNENNLTIENWHKFIETKVKENFEKFKNNNTNFQLLTQADINCLKEAMQVAVTAYDSTSKKDAENEFLMWIELKEDENCGNLVLRNFSELINITKEDGKTKIDLKDVFKYLKDFKNCIEKIEIYYDENFNTVDGIPNKKEETDDSTGKEGGKWNGVIIKEIKTLGKIEKKSDDESEESDVVEKNS